MTAKRFSKEIDRSRCLSCGLRFSVINLLANLALAIVKGLVGFISGSRALLACSLYSIHDVLSAIIVMVSLKVGRRPADKEYAYGYGKAEFIAIGVMSFVMMAGVFFIIYYSVIDIIRGVEGPPHVAALVVAGLSLVASEFLARMGFCAARHLDNSPSLRSSAEHNRADALSSLAVVVGVGGATMGLHVLDQIVAILETLHICWLSGRFFGMAVKGLMDTSLPDHEVEHISRACSRVPGVLEVVALRTRRAGMESWADVAVKVSGNLSVGQAHEIAVRVSVAIREALNRSVKTHVRFKAGAMRDGVESTPGAVGNHA